MIFSWLIVGYLSLYALIQIHILFIDKISSEVLSFECIDNEVYLLDWSLAGNLSGLPVVWFPDESKEAFSLFVTPEII